MKLSLLRNGDTWDKVVTTIEDGVVVFEQRGLVLFKEHANKEYFDNWENQLRGLPHWNIVEVERFI